MTNDDKNGSWGKAILIVIVVVVVIWFVSQGSGDKANDGANASQPTPTAHLTYNYAAPTPTPSVQLRYYVEVESGNHVSVTYHNDQGGVEQVDYTGPWDKVFAAPRGFFASLVAQLDTSYATHIACEIQVNGQTIKRSESNAKFGLVTCSGDVD
jgi:hypothetical protein